jgi:hypothetical protein
MCRGGSLEYCDGLEQAFGGTSRLAGRKGSDAIQCPPSNTFKDGRESGEIRLLRVLAGYRHFSAHAEVIQRQLKTDVTTHGVSGSDL